MRVSRPPDPINCQLCARHDIKTLEVNACDSSRPRDMHYVPMTT